MVTLLQQYRSAGLGFLWANVVVQLVHTWSWASSLSKEDKLVLLRYWSHPKVDIWNRSDKSPCKNVHLYPLPIQGGTTEQVTLRHLEPHWKQPLISCECYEMLADFLRNTNKFSWGLTLRVIDRGGFWGGSSWSLSPKDARTRFRWPIKLIFKTWNNDKNTSLKRTHCNH